MRPRNNAALAAGELWRYVVMTTRPNASPVIHDGVKRGLVQEAPQAPPNGGGEAPAGRPEFFKSRRRVDGHR